MAPGDLIYDNHMEALMRTLNANELEMAGGGISIFTPVNLFMTEQWGPLGAAFGAGYALGTFLYENHEQILAAAAKLQVQHIYY